MEQAFDIDEERLRRGDSTGGSSIGDNVGSISEDNIREDSASELE